jgi:hypothetical protein
MGSRWGRRCCALLALNRLKVRGSSQSAMASFGSVYLRRLSVWPCGVVSDEVSGCDAKLLRDPL